MVFIPTQAPEASTDEGRALAKWVEQELQRLTQALQEDEGVPLNELHVAPTKPREGQSVLADGTDWDPGSGRGPYMYVNGAWTFTGYVAPQDLSPYLTKADNLASVANAATALSNLAGAPLASPALTGNPTAPTQAPGTNNTRISTTAYADAAVAALVVTGRLIAGTPLVLNPFAKSSSTSQAHGLGVAPLYIELAWECLSADIGYSAGDQFMGYTIDRTPTIGFDATNISLITCGDFTPFIVNKSTFVVTAITAASWKLTLTPYKLV